jgi:hypothetical protein
LTLIYFYDLILNALHEYSDELRGHQIMVKSGDIHPYSSDHHRRVSRGVTMWTPLVVELLLLAASAFALSVPAVEKLLAVVGIVMIGASLIGTVATILKRPKLALEPEQRGVTVFDEGAPRREHMKAADGMVVASSTTAPFQSYVWLLVSFVGLTLVVIASWSIL